MPNNRLYIDTHKKYGYLLPIRYAGKDKFGCVQWLCRCDCGAEKIVTSYNLCHGLTLHCGCKTNRAQYDDRAIPAKNIVYGNYKNYASSEKIEFSLTKEEFFKLCAASCYYCGSAPSTVRVIHNRLHPSIYVYNGIDRINSNLGYLPNNVVSCCKKYNFSKSNRSQEDFISWVKKLVSHTRSTDNPIIKEAYLKAKKNLDTK